MTSEWMKVMLDEIERKRKEQEEDRLEQRRRQEESQGRPSPADPKRL